MAGGVVGTIVGAVIIGKNLNDIDSLGPGIAICLLTLFYGWLIGYGFCLPCQHRIESTPGS